MSHGTNPDIDVLYLGGGKKAIRICSIPKGLGKSTGWEKLSDRRDDSSYVTSDNIQHRSLPGIGLALLRYKVIRPHQFVKHFITRRSKEFLARLQAQGRIPLNLK